MTLRLRCVDPERDGAAMAAIYAPHVRDSAVSFELVAPDGHELARRAREYLAAGKIWLVAERDNRCIGYAYAASFRQRAAYDATVETSAYVAADAARSGIGALLYRALFAQLATDGMTQAIAVITLPNPASAAFHERLGFRFAGRLVDVGRKFDRDWDVGLFQRAITPADIDDRPA